MHRDQDEDRDPRCERVVGETLPPRSRAIRRATTIEPDPRAHERHEEALGLKPPPRPKRTLWLEELLTTPRG